MIDWERMLKISSNADEKAALEVLGAEVKDLYIDLITGENSVPVAAMLESFVLESVEKTSQHSSNDLAESYKKGLQPSKDDSGNVGTAFISKVFDRFHEAICAELYDNPDLSSNARGIIVVLAPTIITLLGLPLPYSALAIPISIIGTRVGMRALCKDYDIKKTSKEFTKNRLEIHRKNLLFLEEACSRYSPGQIPEVLREAVAYEELKIRQLEGEVKYLDSSQV